MDKTKNDHHIILDNFCEKHFHIEETMSYDTQEGAEFIHRECEVGKLSKKRVSPFRQNLGIYIGLDYRIAK